ncbi:MAG: hypothetical protein WKF83_11085 [Nocardioidaceae bacterium]
MEIVPARDWAVSTTFPHFGALTTTHSTAMLHPALEERVWMYDVDVAAGVCRFQARRSGLLRGAAAGPDARHRRRRAGRQRGDHEHHPGRARRQHGHP